MSHQKHQNHYQNHIKSICISIFLLAVLISTVQGQYFGGQNPCVSKVKCFECIQTLECAWCMQENFGDKPRCFQPAFTPGICPSNETFIPSNQFSVKESRELTRTASSSGGGKYMAGSSYEAGSSYSASSSGQSRGSAGSSGSGYRGSSSSSAGSQIVQIYPQRVSLKLRVGEEYGMRFTYSQAEDYPVDLYYLMDLSKSMEDDKEQLSQLGNEISNTMTAITNNFRLGFGSFVDKVLMPYVSTIPAKLLHPCENCQAPYGYKNHLKLSNNTQQFSTEVKNAAVSGNLDAPEGGFDAIMQAIVCQEEIGWREQARRLLVFSTDAGFHYAGDGKLGGVIVPNDGKCHLDSNGNYTHSSLQDYPSISQINSKVKEHHINVIFAVTAQQQEVYTKLSDHIVGSSSSILSNDSSNIVNLIAAEYSKITSSVEMKDNASSYVKITYFSSCLTGKPAIQTNKCDNLQVGKKVEFEARIVVTSCPEDENEWLQTIQIEPVGIDEKLVVDLEMLCRCPCEKDATKEELNSSKCNGRGTYQCGICDCGSNSYGRKCECSAADIHKEIDQDISCRRDNVTQVDCTGRGNCVCGVCECEKRKDVNEVISGPFCECDNFSCDRSNQLLCSGPDHGTCKCGDCDCKPGWSGVSCNCRDSTDTCVSPKGGKICSGNGECKCGECICLQNDKVHYTGQYCDKCPACSLRCDELKPCFQCQMYGTGPLADKELCEANCTTFKPIAVEKLDTAEDGFKLCTFWDEDDCRCQFVYSDVDENIIVKAEKDRMCPPKIFLLSVVLAVIAAIVLFGLAILLLWKLFTTIHDRREFARFEKERMMAKWDTGENPIYKQATSTFKNPMYAGK